MSSSSTTSTTDPITHPHPSPVLTPSNHLQIKFTKDNYLSWKAAIISYINGNKISHHIDGATTAPPQHIASFSSPTTILVPNPAYDPWFEIDQLLLSVFLCSLILFLKILSPIP